MSGHEDRQGVVSEEQHQRLCAWLFGELEGDEAAAFERELEASEALRDARRELEATIGLVRANAPTEALSEAARTSLTEAAAGREADAVTSVASPWRLRLLRGGGSVFAAAAAVVIVAGAYLAVRKASDPHTPMSYWLGADDSGPPVKENVARVDQSRGKVAGLTRQEASEALEAELRGFGYMAESEPAAAKPTMLGERSGSHRSLGGGYKGPGDSVVPTEGARLSEDVALGDSTSSVEGSGAAMTYSFYGLSSEQEAELESLATLGYSGDEGGAPAPSSPSLNAARRSALGATSRTHAPDGSQDVPRREASGSGQLSPAPTPGAVKTGSEGWFLGKASKLTEPAAPPAAKERKAYLENTPSEDGVHSYAALDDERLATERTRQLTGAELEELCRTTIERCRIQPRETPSAMFFRCWGDNPFTYARADALSTFAVDVDTASYTLARRYLNDGYLPKKAQIRTEEFLNYFDADLPAPEYGKTFGLSMELAPSLFGEADGAWMLRVGVRGKDVGKDERKPVALTFVVDTSGSMNDERIGFVKQSLALVARELSTTDSIALVTFNNDARVAVPMISAASRGTFEDAVARLKPGGGTNVEAGLRTGFELAASGLTSGASNRVILLSDGVGNIGETDQEALLEKVAGARAEGIYLSTIGVGMGNHSDVFLEQLADKGDGQCHYVDRFDEARRLFVEQFVSMVEPIARDVKIQVEFDSEQVERYRLLGYENRAIRDEDFRNDAIDAGEINAGHQVVALYEIVRRASSADGPLATARLRWKPPFAVDRGDTDAASRVEAETASEIEARLHPDEAASAYRSASTGMQRDQLVAQFAEVLRRSRHARGDDYDVLLSEIKRLGVGEKQAGMIELLKLARDAEKRLRKRDRQVERDELRDAIDRLCELHYLEGLRDQLGEEFDEPHEDDAQLDEAFDDLRQQLEDRIREQLRNARSGSLDAETEQALKELGYVGGER